MRVTLVYSRSKIVGIGNREMDHLRRTDWNSVTVLTKESAVFKPCSGLSSLATFWLVLVSTPLPPVLVFLIGLHVILLFKCEKVCFLVRDSHGVYGRKEVRMEESG